MSEQFDIVVIGAGPSGLAAADLLVNSGYKFAIYEAGLSERRRDSPALLVRGVGGAGLYSDGKFSFYPSASESLRDAYGWLDSLLRPHGFEIPCYGELETNIGEAPKNGSKNYPSFYIPFEIRNSLIAGLEKNARDNLRTASRVVRIDQSPNGFLLYIDSSKGPQTTRTNAIIFAGGRFGPTILRQVMPALPNLFRRIELGIRVEQLASDFLFKAHPSTDVKMISTGERNTEEWRTFCTCRNGEVIETDWDGLKTFSGRADGQKTEFSNIGLNLRFSVPPLDKNLSDEIYSALTGNMRPFEVSGDIFCNTENGFFGPVLDDKFRRQLRKVLSDEALAKVQIYGPCIEGLGYYPDLNPMLKVNSCDLWVAGDATGMFRGLTAALLSGRFAATQVLKHIQRANTPAPVFIKESPTAPMPLIFTAQSKAFFYCRDAVCEFVLNKGLLPLNPFRVFEYFLGDRVERDLIRQGNNRLIEAADELWAFGPIADGVLFEIVRARRLHKPVRFFSIAARSSEIKPISVTDVVFEPEVHSRQTKKADLVALLSDDLGIGHQAESLQLSFSFWGIGGAK